MGLFDVRSLWVSALRVVVVGTMVLNPLLYCRSRPKYLKMTPIPQSNLVDGLTVDGFGISYRNDDDERHEVYPMNAVLGMASDETEESMRMGAPDISRWRNQTQPMKVTVDMARDVSLHQLADEVKFIDSKLEAKFDTRKPDLDALK